MPARRAQLRIGISGWRYEPWRGTFYPADLAQRRELEYASRCLSSIEINGTFYSLQRPSFFEQWYNETPDDFVFSLKGGRYITHMKRLKDVEIATANFFASGILALKEKLGPFLWQFPPNFKYDAQRFEDFFSILPHDTTAAAEFAAKHDKSVAKFAYAKTDRKRPLRHAVEIRHESFETPDFVKHLRRHRVALVIADTAGKWPHMEDITADFVYVRLHGAEELYVSGYTDEALDAWAERVRAWSTGSAPSDARLTAPADRKHPASRDVHVYFDNDVKVRAPFDAMSLMRRLGVESRCPMPPGKPEGAKVRKSRPRTQWPSTSS
jgi:uncharacterized protein YecE (DUF72 family)